MAQKQSSCRKFFFLLVIESFKTSSIWLYLAHLYHSLSWDGLWFEVNPHIAHAETRGRGLRTHGLHLSGVVLQSDTFHPLVTLIQAWSPAPQTPRPFPPACMDTATRAPLCFLAWKSLFFQNLATFLKERGHSNAAFISQREARAHLLASTKS